MRNYLNRKFKEKNKYSDNKNEKSKKHLIELSMKD